MVQQFTQIRKHLTAVATNQRVRVTWCDTIRIKATLRWEIGTERGEKER